MNKSGIDHDLPVSVDVMCYVYNHGEYLRQALDGMLMQETNFPVRIVIHDDASTDNSAEIIKEYIAAYPDRFVARLNMNPRTAAMTASGSAAILPMNRITFMLTASFVSFCLYCILPLSIPQRCR